MNVAVTSFFNPFSFFCKPQDGSKELPFFKNESESEHVRHVATLTDLNHGQYVAVMYKDKWSRGIVSMETHILFWLIDLGIFLYPDDKTIYIELPPKCKTHPTKVFEASIHGVAPVDKVLTDDCQITNERTTTWNMGVTLKAQSLISSAVEAYFVPVGLLITKENEVVLGDLFLRISKRGIVNLVDELRMWPVSLEINKQQYIQNLSTCYTSRKKHRACMLKTEIPGFELPTLTLETTLAEYSAICANAPELELSTESSDVGLTGSTVIEADGQDKQEGLNCELTRAEMEKYSRMYLVIHGREYNMLNVLVKKIRDLIICERYKDHDLKSVGRACFRRPPLDSDSDD